MDKVIDAVWEIKDHGNNDYEDDPFAAPRFGAYNHIEMWDEKGLRFLRLLKQLNKGPVILNAENEKAMDLMRNCCDPDGIKFLELIKRIKGDNNCSDLWDCIINSQSVDQVSEAIEKNIIPKVETFVLAQKALENGMLDIVPVLMAYGN